MANPTIQHLAADLAAGRTSSRRLTEQALARIEDPKGEGSRAFVKVWREQALAAADASWHFVSLPRDLSEEIRDGVDHSRPGFGSVRVEVAIGATRWRTSIFPDSKRGTYLLPVKQAVRRAEGLSVGDPATVTLTVLG